MITVGTLLMLSTEEYSDMCMCGPYKVVKEFDIHAIAEFVNSSPPFSPEIARWRNKNGPDDVIRYLEKNGFIELLPSEEYHLGSYGNIEVTP